MVLEGEAEESTVWMFFSQELLQAVLFFSGWIALHFFPNYAVFFSDAYQRRN